MNTQLPGGVGDITVCFPKGVLNDMALENFLGLLELHILGKNLPQVCQGLVVTLLGEQLSPQVKIDIRAELVAALNRQHLVGNLLGQQELQPLLDPDGKFFGQAKIGLPEEEVEYRVAPADLGIT